MDLGTEATATIRHKADVYRRYAAAGRNSCAGVFPRVVFLASVGATSDPASATLRAQPDGTACSRSAAR